MNASEERRTLLEVTPCSCTARSSTCTCTCGSRSAGVVICSGTSTSNGATTSTGTTSATRTRTGCCSTRATANTRGSRRLNESVQLDTIGNRAIGLSRARPSGVDSCVQTQGDVAALITTELGELGPRELTMEKSIQFGVLWCRLTVWNLKTVGL